MTLQMKSLRSEDKCIDLANQFEKEHRNRNIAHNRILMALWETGAQRYVMLKDNNVVAAVAIKRKWSRVHVLQLGSICKGCGSQLFERIKKLPLEVVTTNGSRGFWIKMGLMQKPGPYHNVFITKGQ